MFVMLSVQTSNSVRERTADTSIKQQFEQLQQFKIVQYSNIKSTQIENLQQQQQQQQQAAFTFNNIFTNKLTIDEDDEHHHQNYHHQQQQQQQQQQLHLQDQQKQKLHSATFILPDDFRQQRPLKTLSIDRDLSLQQLQYNKPNFILTDLNNFKKPPVVQVPVATILNDLSPVPAPTKVKNKNNLSPLSPMTPKGLQTNTPDAKAMRYYRLWIYTCNAVLLMAVIVFCGVAGKVLLADYKRLLVNGLNLGQPSFIYAYLALLVQSGFLQLVGCLGALRLSEKLLNAYWLILLILLIGDALLGIFWMFKFDKIMHDIQPMLRQRLVNEYGSSIEFSEIWDRLQYEGRCCGILGPQDFTLATINRTYPTSCCYSDVSRRPLAVPVISRTDDNNIMATYMINGLPRGVNFTEITDYALNHVIATNRADDNKPLHTNCRQVYQQGCADKIILWLRNTADILFVLGYCVIAFLKLCFLGILRYEIREMIQKIKLLQTEMATAILCPEMEQQQQQQQLPPHQQQQQLPPHQQLTLQQPLQQSTSINGGIHAEPKVGNRDRERTRIGSGESERESLLAAHHQQQHQQQQHEQCQTPTKSLIKHKQQLYACTEHSHSLCHGHTTDSDTNSNCALIVDDLNHHNHHQQHLLHHHNHQYQQQQQQQQPHHMHNQCVIGTSGASVAPTKSINGNNNYELTEFDTKAPTYRLLSAPTVTKI